MKLTLRFVNPPEIEGFYHQLKKIPFDNIPYDLFRKIR